MQISLLNNHWWEVKKVQLTTFHVIHQNELFQKFIDQFCVKVFFLKRTFNIFTPNQLLLWPPSWKRTLSKSAAALPLVVEKFLALFAPTRTVLNKQSTKHGVRALVYGIPRRPLRLRSLITPLYWLESSVSGVSSASSQNTQIISIRSPLTLLFLYLSVSVEQTRLALASFPRGLINVGRCQTIITV